MSRAPELPEVYGVTAKEFAASAGLTVDVVRARMRLWRRRPKHPLAIPYLVHLGRPYKIRRDWAEAALGLKAAA